MRKSKNGYVSRGFTLIETIFALTVLVLTILTLAALTTSNLKSNEKAKQLSRASQVIETILERTLHSVHTDSPVGTRDSFWNADSSAVWSDGTETIGNVEYEWEMRVADVPGVGDPALSTRLKKVQATIWWWDSKAENGNKQGYGRLQLGTTRLVSERAAP